MVLQRSVAVSQNNYILYIVHSSSFIDDDLEERAILELIVVAMGTGAACFG